MEMETPTDVAPIQAAETTVTSDAMTVDVPNTTSTTAPPAENSIVQYMAKSGDVFDFDTSQAACEKWGFFAGSRVMTPRGTATVIGVCQGFLWFHVDGDRGASYWDNCKTYEDLLHNNFHIWQAPEPEPDLKKGEYRVKRIDYKDKPALILLQNENGPCPLIAMANILALRGHISLEAPKQRISVDEVVKRIVSFMKQQATNEEETKQVEDLGKLLQELQVGMDVNFGFTACDSFEPTKQSKVFQFCNLRMLHGWLADPQSREGQIIGNLTYNDVTLKLVTLQEEISKPLNPSSTTANTNTNSNSNSNEPPKPEEKKEDERKFTREEGDIVSDFLAFTCSQLTEYGLGKLSDTLQEDELVVFFRNNHFTTLTKHNGLLYNLVTDIGYERERNVVWDLMKSVQEDSCLCSAEFVELNDAKREETLNTAVLCGFTREQAEEGLRMIHKAGQEYNTDELVQWLSKKYTPNLSMG